MRGRRPSAALVGLLTLGCGAGAAQSPEQIAEADASPENTAALAGEPTDGSNWSTIYAEGITFEAFLDAADRRRDTWHTNYERAEVPDDVLERAAAIPGNWRVLVIAEDWCGDSANTIPYLARLMEQVDGFEMRVVNSEVGAPVAKTHLTPDGRPATPTVVILDSEGRDVGCWVERPAALQEWFLGAADQVSQEVRLERKYSWYDWDVGESTMSEVTDVIAAAAAGTTICR